MVEPRAVFPVALRIFLIYAVVAVLAGAIAYLGNQLGRKIGRKKMSLFGMRPKNTSNFITTLTGSLIAILTLTLFAIVSEQVRQLLVGIDRLEQRLVYLTEQVRKKEQLLTQGRIVYGVGEPILLGTVNPALGDDQLRKQVQAAISAANAQAIMKNNKMAAQRQEPLLDADESLLQWDNAAVDNLLLTLRSENKIVGLRIEAGQNCLFRDKVPIRLETMPVTLVFKEGEVVASKTLQGSSPKIIREWYDFLDEMRANALHKGMIPINDSLGGGISEQDLSQLINGIEALKGKATLVAIARRDLYQTSPLDVRVEVKPAAASVGHSARVPLVGSRGHARSPR